MCGTVGVISKKEAVSPELAKLNQEVQHRGEDTAGILTLDEKGKAHLHKKTGLVRDVFDPSKGILERLIGNVGLGHVRYRTFGGSGNKNAQPFYAEAEDGSIFGIGNNGHVVNAKKLTTDLTQKGFKFKSTNDIEHILYTLIDGWNNTEEEMLEERLKKSAKNVLEKVTGGYFCVGALNHKQKHYLFAFKDPLGIRPGLIGFKDNMVAFSSESNALENNGYRAITDLNPGDLVVADEHTVISWSSALSKGCKACHFEFPYFSRASSVIYGRVINDVRHHLGEKLAEENKDLWNKIDVITYVPNCPQEMARAFSETIGKLEKYKTAIEKNRYAGRVFLKERQDIREDEAERAFVVLPGIVTGKRVAVIDDSVVRGTNAIVIVRKLLEAGAREVYWLSCTPPIKYGCTYGIDMKTPAELAAGNRNLKQLTKYITADTVRYISMKGYFEVLCNGNRALLQDKIHRGIFNEAAYRDMKPSDFCTHCLTGVKPTKA
ncbi:amidophosphoribosyltransferase [bacterium]|nr:amidophosphoribosyltransferase [bacterium]